MTTMMLGVRLVYRRGVEESLLDVVESFMFLDAPAPLHTFPRRISEGCDNGGKHGDQRLFWVHEPTRDSTSAGEVGDFISLMKRRLRSLRTAKPQNLLTLSPMKVSRSMPYSVQALRKMSRKRANFVLPTNVIVVDPVARRSSLRTS